MTTNAGRADDRDADGPDAESRDAPTLTACDAGADRTVLLESDNTDGWIASDLTVDAESFR